MYIEDILKATGGELLSGDKKEFISGFTQDSRECKEGMLYIAIEGANHDGHDYIEAAFSNGSKTALVSKIVQYSNKNIILVKDTVKALGDIARYKRNTINAIVVGLTGSVGKTSTKDMIYSVLSQKYKTLKTEGNHNNHIGVPLTILRYKDEEAMVVEMGMNHLKEIDYLTNITQPNIAAITNVGTAHIGELGSRENILQAKMEIINGLKPNGILVLNGDNDMLKNIVVPGLDIKYVSIDNSSDLRAKNLKLYPDSSTFRIKYEGHDYNVFVPVAGIHFIMNALIAIQVGISAGVPIEECIKGVKHFELTKSRADIIYLKDNIIVYDGTYNANLDSMLSSIDVLATNSNRKIAILGDMLELGEYEEEIHRKVGKYLLEKNIDIVYLIGNATSFIEEELQNSNIIVSRFSDIDSLNSALKSTICPNDVILVKASHSLNFKEIIFFLKEAYKE
jgi:UDP-N-acetylmuramoyl-tripeptide--D-alanyl-D-alanine ligase